MVEEFLSRLFGKLLIRRITFIDSREKNLETLSVLGIPASRRTEVIKTLTPEDYSEGPIVSTLMMWGDMWVFGKDVNGHECYIKISLGKDGGNVICVSFHVAEHPMDYPFKRKDGES